jgi:alpha-mannosidase
MDTEKLASFAWIEGGEYPGGKIEEAWRILLFNQFHDILPGSSIGPVYLDAEADYTRMFATSDEVRSGAASHLGWTQRPLRAGDSLVVVNTLSWPRTDIAEVKTADDLHVVDSEGQAVPCQRVAHETIIFLAEDVPSMGWKAYRLEEGTPSTDAGEVQATETALANRFYDVQLDPKTGSLAGVRDKRLDWDVLAAGERGNVMQLFDDNPAQWDAWNIGLGELTEISDVKEMRVTEKGPVRATVRVVRSNGTSTVTQDVSIYNGVPRIDFRTDIDWHEKHKMLKAAFPLNVDADKAWYEIPYAAVARANKPKTEAEKAKWEVAALRWASLSADGKCASILNDCKYGYDCKDNLMRLSLLRAPTSPDPHADEGEHSVTYSLYTSGGDWRAGTVRAGRELNTPLLVFGAREDVTPERSYFSVEPDNVILEAVKKAEDSDALVLRLFEFAGEDCTARLKLPKQAKKAVETDLLERESNPLEIEGATIAIPMGHNSITTVKVEF